MVQASGRCLHNTRRFLHIALLSKDGGLLQGVLRLFLIFRVKT